MTTPRLMTLLAILALTIGLIGCSSDNAPTTPDNNHLLTFDPNAQPATPANPDLNNWDGSDLGIKLADQGLEALFATDDKALPPCITVIDDFGYIWTLYISGGVITGTMVDNNYGCGTWTVSGSGNQITAYLDVPNANCCDSFTYYVTYLDIPGRMAGGSWTNSCGGTGTWSASQGGPCK